MTATRKPSGPEPFAVAGASALLLLLALSALPQGCDHAPRYEFLYLRDDAGEAPPPPPRDGGLDGGFDSGPARDFGPGDPWELYDRHCAVCHGQYGRGAPGGPALDEALRHNSRETTYRVTRFGGGEMEEQPISEEEAWFIVDLLAYFYGEGFRAPPTGDAARGQALFQQHCALCHLEGGAVELLVPELTPVASTVSEQLLDELLQRPQGIGWMPAVALQAGQRQTLISYLKDLARGAAPEPAAAELFTGSCGGCHVDGGARRMRVPTVGQGGYLTPAALRQLCVEGHGEMPASMPALDDDAALDLQAYLRSVELQRFAPGQWPPLVVEPAGDGAVERGRSLYEQRCQVCHGDLGAQATVFPDLREAGFLHSEQYLIEVTRDGAGDMPGFPELSGGELSSLADYLERLSEEVHGSGPAVGELPLFRQHCAGCHPRGGRSAAQVPGLGHAGRDLSATRIRAVLQGGLGSMPPQELQADQVDDLLALLQQGLAAPAPSEADLAASRATFQFGCGGCHHDDGLAPTRIPGVGDVMGRASEELLEQVVSEGLGWMPPVSGAGGATSFLADTLGKLARGEQPSDPGIAAYDTYCRSCHLDPAVGDEVPAVAYPSLVNTVAGRLSPRFLDDLLGGLGTMSAVSGLNNADTVLRPYLGQAAELPLRQDTGLPAAGGGQAARQAFDAICGPCHPDGGLAGTRMPRMAQKLRLLSGEYVHGILADLGRYTEMPPLTLSAAELADLDEYTYAMRHRQPASGSALETFRRRCAGCHPEADAAPPIVVPHLVPTGARLSRKAVLQMSLLGLGRMVPAFHLDGRLPSEAEVEQVFPQLAALTGQQGRPFEEPALDAQQVAAGKTLFQRECAGPTCHGQSGMFDLGPRTVAGREVLPLEGLSRKLLRTVTREGLADMPATESGSLSDQELEAVVEYMLALGRGQRP